MKLKPLLTILAMNYNHAIKICKTIYKRVYEYQYPTGDKPNYFSAKLSKRVGDKMEHLGQVRGTTAKECALKLDTKLIELGLEPINVLKRTK